MSRVKIGARLGSAVSAAQFIVVRAPDRDLDLRCGGAALVESDTSKEQSDGGSGQELQLGKRYVNTPEDLELLCTKAGHGDLSCDSELMHLREAKPLPTSD
jgi:hypothetical protein